MSWIKEKKCETCGIKFENKKPVFPTCFVCGFEGGNLNTNGHGISICDFGSLIYCNWGIRKTSKLGEWRIEKDKAHLLYPTEKQLYTIYDYKFYDTYIWLLDSNGNEHKICCCDCIYVEWL
jgi:hypothetical protein